MSHLLCTTLLTLGNIPGHNPEHFHFLRAISYSGTRSSSPFREGTWRCSACSVSMQGTIFHWYILLRMQQTHLQDLHKPTWTSGLILPNGSIFQETVQSQIFFFFCLFIATAKQGPEFNYTHGKKQFLDYNCHQVLVLGEMTYCLLTLFMFSETSIALLPHTIQLSLLLTEGQ